MKHLELFSGIGGFRQGLALLEKDFGITQEVIGYSEIDKAASETYCAAFDTRGEIVLGDIVKFTDDIENIKNLPKFDLLTAGFPCQPFSMMGEQKGFADERGTMFFKILQIIDVCTPRYVLLENVRNLMTHDNKRTFTKMKNLLKARKYKVYHALVNSMDFALAQKRNRVYVFATTDDLGEGFEFDEVVIKKAFDELLNSAKPLSIERQPNTHEILEKVVDEKYYLSERIKPTILADGSANFKSHSEINQMIARPLTATMTKMHRACQDNYYSDGFIQSDDPELYLKTKYTKEELCTQRIRKITPREAFLLQGFNGEYLERVLSSNVCNGSLYRQAGNAVSVNTVYAIAYYLFVKNGLK